VSIVIRHIDRAAANDAVTRWHRHHKPVRAAYFQAGAYRTTDVDPSGELVGVAIVGRPNAPALCTSGTVAEVLRVATPGGPIAEHAASKLLGACWSAARGLGFRRLVSYTRADEAGTSYRAAGWRRTARVKGREWAGENKPGRWLELDGVSLFEATTETIDRVRWEIGPDAAPALDREAFGVGR